VQGEGKTLGTVKKSTGGRKNIRYILKKYRVKEEKL